MNAAEVILIFFAGLVTGASLIGRAMKKEMEEGLVTWGGKAWKTVQINPNEVAKNE